MRTFAEKAKPARPATSATASSVMRMPVPQIQRACPCGGECPKCRKHAPTQGHVGLQMKHTGAGDLAETAVAPIVGAVLRSTGRPLDVAARAFMEPRFGHDFSDVRVHTDETAARSADAIHANAYTSGRHVVFGKDKYGLQLLAHELAHVVQQQGGVTGRIQRQAADAGARPPIAANAYSGIDLYYMVAALPYSEFSDTQYLIHAGDYILGPNMLRTDPPTVAYYLAYRRSGRRNEWVVGPASVDRFVRDVENYERIANAAYAWVAPGQQIPAYQALSARAVGRVMEGDIGGYFSGLGDAWGAAFRDPGWWMQAITSTAGALAGMPGVPRGGTTPPALRVIQGGGAAAAPVVVGTPRVAAPILATEGSVALAPVAAAAPAPVIAPRFTVLPGGATMPAPVAAPLTPLIASGATAVAATTAPSTLSVPLPAPQTSRDRRNECRQLHPSALDCDDIASTDIEEVAIDFLVNQGYSFEDLGDCRGIESFPSGAIDACMGAPGERWHCRVNRTRYTISIFGCLCCHSDGSTGFQWRGAHWSVNLSRR